MALLKVTASLRLSLRRLLASSSNLESIDDMEPTKSGGASGASLLIGPKDEQ
jgi:hypothetical protein